MKLFITICTLLTTFTVKSADIADANIFYLGGISRGNEKSPDEKRYAQLILKDPNRRSPGFPNYYDDERENLLTKIINIRQRSCSILESIIKTPPLKPYDPTTYTVNTINAVVADRRISDLVKELWLLRCKIISTWHTLSDPAQLQRISQQPTKSPCNNWDHKKNSSIFHAESYTSTETINGYTCYKCASERSDLEQVIKGRETQVLPLITALLEEFENKREFLEGNVAQSLNQLFEKEKI